MMIPCHNEPLKTYKSYKTERFEKIIQKAKMLRNSINDSSLKYEDKKRLVELVQNEIF